MEPIICNIGNICERLEIDFFTLLVINSQICHPSHLDTLIKLSDKLGRHVVVRCLSVGFVLTLHVLKDLIEQRYSDNIVKSLIFLYTKLCGMDNRDLVDQILLVEEKVNNDPKLLEEFLELRSLFYKVSKEIPIDILRFHTIF